jgi:hypothetical protein
MIDAGGLGIYCAMACCVMFSVCLSVCFFSSATGAVAAILYTWTDIYYIIRRWCESSSLFQGVLPVEPAVGSLGVVRMKPGRARAKVVKIAS